MPGPAFHDTITERTMALYAGEHPVRVAAGAVRPCTVRADGARFRGKPVDLCTLRAQDGGDLPRQLLVRAARGECRLGVRDIRDLRQRRDEQALRIGQAARPARLHGADGGRTGPCFVIARTVLAADRADALGEFQLRRFEPDIFRQRQLRQLRLDRGTVHALSSRFRYSRS